MRIYYFILDHFTKLRNQRLRPGRHRIDVEPRGFDVDDSGYGYGSYFARAMLKDE